MRYASSLLYGGMLVDAANADYQDYKRLLLRCPVCGKEVHLVAAKHRSEHARLAPKSKQIVLVRACSVDACFAHFDGIEDDRCVRKTAQMGQAEITKRQVSSRGQRVKIFQRRFWQMVEYSHGFGGSDREEPRKMLHRLFGLIRPDPPSLHDYKIEWMQEQFCDRFPNAKDYLKELAAELLRNAQSSPVTALKFRPGTERYEMTQVLDWLSSVEIDLHIAVVQEAIDYLCTKSARPILAELMLQALHSWHNDRVVIEKLPELGFAQTLCRDFEQTITVTCATTISCLCLVRWAEAMHELDQKVRA